jgi:hypothetical protein
MQAYPNNSGTSARMSPLTFVMAGQFPTQKIQCVNTQGLHMKNNIKSCPAIALQRQGRDIAPTHF